MLFICLILIITIQSTPNSFGSYQVIANSNLIKKKDIHKSIYEYNFTGVQFQIFSTYNKNYTIYLDNKFYATVNFTPINDRKQNYISRYLPFGKHKIKLVGADKKFKIDKFTYLPSSNIRKIDHHAFYHTDNWKVSSDNTYTYAFLNGHYLSIHIRCAKFWVYGFKDSYHGNISVQFGDVVDTIFSEEGEANYEPHVVYESPDFPLIEGDLILKNDNQGPSKSTSIAYVLILAEPLPYPASDPVSVSADSMENFNTVDKTDYECPLNEATDEPCGIFQVPNDKSKSCWLQYSFRGVRFQIFGTFGPGLGKYRVYLDGVHLETINQEFGTTQNFALQIYPIGHQHLQLI